MTESHHIAQPFQKSLLLLQSIRKYDIVSNYYSMIICHQFLFLCFLTIHYMKMFYVLLYTEMFVMNEVCFVYKNGILKIVFQKLLSLPLKFV